MSQRTPGRLLTLLLMAGLFPVAAGAQVRTRATWFDINPNQSNTDADNPNGASGGRVNRLGAASDFSRVFAATEWGGLYQSFDQGNTWIRVNTFAPAAAWDVKVDPRNSARVYVTSFFDGRVNPQSGISVSTNAGATWAPVNIPGLNVLNCAPRAAQEPAGWDISVNSTTPSTVFAGTSCGVARTLDSGVNWAFFDPSPADGVAEQVFTVAAHGNQLVDVVSANGHFRSTDNGATWTPVPVGGGPVAGNSVAGTTLAVSPAESYVLLAANTQTPGGGVPSGINIWESVDGGQTWPTSLTPPTRSGGLSVAQGRIPFIRTNQLATSTQFDVWFGDVNVFKTTAITPSTAAQGGPQRTPQNSWASMQGEAHWDSGNMLFDPRFSAGACPSMFTGDGGIYRNLLVDNPGCQTPRWEQPTITPHATWLFGFDGVQRQPGVHALSYGLQDNGGYAATFVFEGHNPPAPNWNNYTCCDVLHNSFGSGLLLSLQGASNNGRAFKLFKRNQDGGGANEIPNYPSPATFSRFESGKQNAPFGGTGYVVNLSDGVYFTNNILANPIAWTSLNAPTAATSSSGHVKIANLQGFPNVYYHTGTGNPESRGSIFRSTLQGPITAPGTNWVPLALPRGVVTATAFDVDPNNGNRVIISGINTANNFEVHMTQNFGASWNRLNALETAMLGTPAAGGPGLFLNRVTQGKNTGTFNFGTYWQPSLFKFNPLDATTILAGAVDAGVFLSFSDGATWERISTPVNPTSASPHIPRPLFAYFSPGRFAASTTSFDVWLGTRGAGVTKVLIER